ncbi:MAG: cytochrome c3 family protein, partial [Ignavibacteria bacterium]|nr:cytochrome c3 family protein [Ignavibacteria bacterium]
LNIITSVLILFLFQYSNAATDQCLKCHQDLGDKPSKHFLEDVHYKAGLSCKSCHGGNSNSEDMELAMSKSEGFIGVPALDKISETCSKCHSDIEYMKNFNSKIQTGQLEKLKASVHGKLAVNGRGMMLQCITCHNAHGIKKVNNPGSPVYPVNIPQTCNKCHGNASFMQSYNPAIAVDQFTKYRTSVHGVLNSKGNTKVAECASCHGSHDIFPSKDVRSKVYKLNIPGTCSNCHSDKEYMKDFPIPTDQFTKYQKSVHGVAVFEKQDLSAPVCNDCHGNHGATPPGIESISKVCGSCHALNAELFSASPHKKAFDEKKYPECETCHGNHEILIAKDQLLGIEKGAICLKCHSESENEKGYFIAKEMKKLTDSLIFSDSVAKNLIYQAEQKGMDVEEIKFKLREVHQARLEGRTIVHSFDETKFKDVAAKGFKSSELAITEAKAAIDEFYFRRYGLGIALAIISFLIIIIFLYIKKIEKN